MKCNGTRPTSLESIMSLPQKDSKRAASKRSASTGASESINPRLFVAIHDHRAKRLADTRGTQKCLVGRLRHIRVLVDVAGLERHFEGPLARILLRRLPADRGNVGIAT